MGAARMAYPSPMGFGPVAGFPSVPCHRAFAIDWRSSMGATPHYVGRPDAGSAFEAKYPGRCHGCEEPFHTGDMVQYRDDKLYAAHDCGSDGAVYINEKRSDGRERINVMPHGKTARDACPLCFLIHPSNQRECY